MSSRYMYIDEEWVKALGLSRRKIAKLSLRGFSDLCAERGIRPVVSVKYPSDTPGLNLQTTTDGPALSSPVGEE